MERDDKTYFQGHPKMVSVPQWKFSWLGNYLLPQTSAENFALSQAFRAQLVGLSRETGGDWKNSLVGMLCKKHILLRPLGEVFVFVEKTVYLRNLPGIGGINRGLLLRFYSKTAKKR